MPQRSNYGGLLQAYALQTVLSRLGNEVEILQREYPYNALSFKEKVNLLIRPCVCKIRRERYPLLTSKEKQIISRNTDVFVQKYFKRSPMFYDTQSLKKYCESSGIDGYVVGSDQVWRPRYCPSVSDYFLGFTRGRHVKRIAYATSFGVDSWEYSEEDTSMCQQLVKDFDAVGVREDSAVMLCKDNLKVDVQHVLDPTMLLTSEDYVAIATEDRSTPSYGKLFYYLLDSNEEKTRVVNAISKALDIKSYGCMPEKAYRGEVLKNRDRYTFPSPAQWIRSFMDAEVVVTDSFHGTVFSILFNKPFWVLGNVRRGNTRMESLLRMFELENRMIASEDINQTDWSEPIDWNKTNCMLSDWRSRSMQFLTNALK